MSLRFLIIGRTGNVRTMPIQQLLTSQRVPVKIWANDVNDHSKEQLHSRNNSNAPQILWRLMPGNAADSDRCSFTGRMMGLSSRTDGSA